MKNINEAKKYLNDVAAEFAQATNDEEKIKMLIDFGQDLSLLPQSESKTEYKVDGCISNTYVKVFLSSDKTLKFESSSDSLISKGYLSIITNAFESISIGDFQNYSDALIDEFISKSQLHLSLTPSRANAFGSVIKHIHNHVNQL